MQSRFSKLNKNNKKLVLNSCINRIKSINSRQNSYYQEKEWLKTEMRRHEIGMHKRYTLAFACFIFLFIGAPLGAIIRKGGAVGNSKSLANGKWEQE